MSGERARVAAEFEKQTGQKLDVIIEDELSGRDRDKAEAAAAEKELRAALLEWMILQRDFLPLPVSNPGAKK